MWVKKMSASANDTPHRIIWRCVPSPQSNMSVSPSRWIARDETLRSTVGRDAEVPRMRTDKDMGQNKLVLEARSADKDWFLRRSPAMPKTKRRRQPSGKPKSPMPPQHQEKPGIESRIHPRPLFEAPG